MLTTRPSLLLRIRDRGDDHAWFEFYEVYRPILQAFARARRAPESEIDDLVQDCMAEVQKRMPDFEYDPRRGHFRGWLRTVINSRLCNLRRRRREQSMDPNSFVGVRSDDPSPEEQFDAIWNREHLRYVLRRLRDELDQATYEAFHRYAVEGQPVGQVCSAMQIRPERLYKIKLLVKRKIQRRMIDLTGESDLPC